MFENSYRAFFFQHLDFAIEYISLHYPFTEAQALKNLPYLIKGSAYYSEFVPDTGSMMRATIGLSFNQNVEWTLALKRLWKVGYEITSPDCASVYGGYYDSATGLTITWGNITPDTLYDIIPLHCYKELVDEECILNDYYNGQGGQLAEITADKIYARLTPMELVELFYYDHNIILYNDSIWEHTFKDVLTYDLVQEIILAYREPKIGALR